MRFLVSLVLTLMLCAVTQAQGKQSPKPPPQAPKASVLPSCNCVNCPLAGACNGTCGVQGCGVQASSYRVRVVEVQSSRRAALPRLFTGRAVRGGCCR